MDSYLLQIFNGISVSSVLLLAALGLAITFGLMRIINMAHGEMIMIGAYTTYMVQNLFISFLGERYFELYFIAAIPLSFLITGFVGYLLEISIVKRLYGRTLDSLLATWGISLILQQLARNIFGAPNVDVRSPRWLNGGVVVLEIFSSPTKGFLYPAGCPLHSRSIFIPL